MRGSARECFPDLLNAGRKSYESALSILHIEDNQAAYTAHIMHSPAGNHTTDATRVGTEEEKRKNAANQRQGRAHRNGQGKNMR